MSSISLPNNLRSHAADFSSSTSMAPPRPSPAGATCEHVGDGVDAGSPGQKPLPDGPPQVILAAGAAQLALGLAALSWAIGKILDGANALLSKALKNIPKPDIAPPPVDGGSG
jgi:hypothetical protein